MTHGHHDPTYQRNARIIRKQVTTAHQHGQPVHCIGCGHPITPDQTYDIGHRIDHALGGTNNLDNLGPQHRRENRKAGGRLGQRLTHTNNRRTKGLPTW